MPAEKMDGLSLNPQAELLALLKERAPEVFVEGRVDAAKLAATLGQAVSTDKERYGLNWAGKSECFRHIQEPTTATLRPCREASVDFDTTENLFIEGDNLNVLKVLQKSYYGRVKMIYIDPPYNTGSDSFIYPDKFSETQDEYLKRIGDKDAEGNLIRDGFWRKNSKDAGHFHSNWLSMMYPRLFLARNLLRQDGVIFVSIDDNEVHNLRMIMNEIFGEENFISCVIWQHSVQGKNDAKTFSLHHNYILIYSKSMECEILRMSRTEEHNVNYSNPDNDPKGPWRSGDVRSPHLRKNLKFIIKTPKGKIISPPENGWRWTKQQVQEKIKSGEIVFSEKQDRIIRKIYLCEQKGRVPETIWFGKDAGTTREANQEIKDLFEGNSPFDTPKPVPLIKRMLNISCETGDIVLDFAGSCDSRCSYAIKRRGRGQSQFICVQLPEACDRTVKRRRRGLRQLPTSGGSGYVGRRKRLERKARANWTLTGARWIWGSRRFGWRRVISSRGAGCSRMRPSWNRR